MNSTQRISFCLLILGFAIHSCCGLTCSDPAIKVTIRTSNPNEIDQYEQFLFQGVMAYAVRKFCGGTAPHSDCANVPPLTNTSNVKIADQTDRFAMCVSVDDCTPALLQEAIKTSQPQFNGAMMQTDETLLYEGVPVTLKPEVEPAFPTWLIPYIIFMSLVVIAAVAIISYTVVKSKKKTRKANAMGYDDDESSVSAQVYENGGYSRGDDTTATAM